jgi:hypothetical protein
VNVVDDFVAEEGPQIDCWCAGNKEKEVHRLVVEALLGIAGSNGATKSCAVVRSVVKK